MGVYEDNIIPIKISRLAEYMAERKSISLDEALACIYTNPMYPELYDEGAKWWYLSTAALYEEFELRRVRDSHGITREAFEFYVYTLEKYAIGKGLNGLEAIALFKRYDVDNYLVRNYDMLHTQGTGYVIDEIDRYIERRKRK